MENMYLFMTLQVDRRGPAILYLCSSHVIARLSKTVPGFEKGGHKRLFLSCFGALLTATSLKDATDIWKLMVRVFNSPFMDQVTRNALHGVTSETFGCELIRVSEDNANVTHSTIEEVLDEERIAEASPFKTFFRQIMEDNTSSGISGPPNPHHNPEVIELLYRQWLPLFGLWSAAALVGTGYHYLTNAKVESFFS